MGIKLVFANGDWLCDGCGMRNVASNVKGNLCRKAKAETDDTKRTSN